MQIVEFSVLDSFQEQRIDRLIESTFIAQGKESLAMPVSYIILELAGNAAKANLKRVYLGGKGIALDDDTACRKAVLSFKHEISVRRDWYREQLSRSGYQVRISVGTGDSHLVFSVRNNTPLLAEERVRIEERIRQAARFHSLDDLQQRGLDTKEGGGIGLTICVLLLRSIGLDETCLDLIGDEHATVFRLQIPLDLLDETGQEKISEAIRTEIAAIPQLPEQVSAIARMAADRNADYDRLTALVQSDPAFSAELLKIANSAAYVRKRPVSSIREALTVLGLRGIGNLAYGFFGTALLSDRYRINLRREQTEHATRVAATATAIARQAGISTIQDDVYSAGLLHDIGRIIAGALSPDTVGVLQAICRQRGVNPVLLERLGSGYNHSLIGAGLAASWRLPASLIDTIRYHHIPLECPLENRELVFTIHLADSVEHYRKGELRYAAIRPQVLERFSIDSEKDFGRYVKHFA